MRFAAILALVGLAAWLGKPAAATELGVAGTRFTIDGRPTFLYGISYYGALGASEARLRRDLDAMERYGLNWLRVWATWAAFGQDVSAVDPEGQPREPYLSRLRALVAECDRRGLCVDVTLSRGDEAAGAPRLGTPEAHRRAVETLIAALAPYRNWYLDLSNERNIGDRRHTSFEELRELRAVARRLAPRLLVTASHGGDMNREDVRKYLLTVGVDFLTPHRPREPGSPARTEATTRELFDAMRAAGRIVPVHYQEPFRRGYGSWQPTVEDFVTDALGARAGGAAGWCFHNGDERRAPEGRPRRSFDLREQDLFEQLDAVERAALERLRAALRSDG